jgi:hypothetical protein
MTHRLALQGFPDTSQTSLKQNILTYNTAVPARSREVTAALNFISKRTVYRQKHPEGNYCMRTEAHSDL